MLILCTQSNNVFVSKEKRLTCLNIQHYQHPQSEANTGIENASFQQIFQHITYIPFASIIKGKSGSNALDFIHEVQ